MWILNVYDGETVTLTAPFASLSEAQAVADTLVSIPSKSKLERRVTVTREEDGE